MSFLKDTFNLLTDRRDIKNPVIYKEFNEREEVLHSLDMLVKSSNPKIDQKKAEEHLKLFSIGQAGEKSVLFELKNSMVPMLVLHDVNIDYDGYQAQMDFVVITHKFVLILEVKKLFGNVKITEKGEFIRVITKGNRVVNKEGMYSPINQVERHVAILEKFLKTEGIIKKCPIRYAVSFANPKTIIDISKKAPAEIQTNVIRHDQIKTFLRNELEKKSPVLMMDDKLYNIAAALLHHNSEKPFDKSNYFLSEQKITQNNGVKENATDKNTRYKSTEELTATLKQFRLKRSRELGVKPFYIFTNKTLDSLVEKQPKSKEELLQVEGIGPKKYEEFGREILAIFHGEM